MGTLSAWAALEEISGSSRPEEMQGFSEALAVGIPERDNGESRRKEDTCKEEQFTG